jgi:hypothetical protein
MKKPTKKLLEQLELAKIELAKLGFVFAPNDPNDKLIPFTKWGKKEAEPYSNDLIKNNHWQPRYRDVFIAFDYPIGGPYITSSIWGKFRRKRARLYNAHDCEIANIFASGKDLPEAVKNFVIAFNNKDYNVSK